MMIKQTVHYYYYYNILKSIIEKSNGWQSSAGRKLYLLVTFSWCIVALVTFSLYSYCLIDTDTNILETAREKYMNECLSFYVFAFLLASQRMTIE